MELLATRAGDGEWHGGPVMYRFEPSDIATAYSGFSFSRALQQLSSQLPVSGCSTTILTLQSSSVQKRRLSLSTGSSLIMTAYPTSTTSSSSRTPSSTGRFGLSPSCSTSASCLSTPSLSSHLLSLPTWDTPRE